MYEKSPGETGTTYEAHLPKWFISSGAAPIAMKIGATLTSPCRAAVTSRTTAYARKMLPKATLIRFAPVLWLVSDRSKYHSTLRKREDGFDCVSPGVSFPSGAL